jgi:hypothetical protein
MEPLEYELLKAAVNCYNTCMEDFENTVKMISDARNLDSEEVKKILMRLKDKYRNDPDYVMLRSRLPSDFPV